MMRYIVIPMERHTPCNRRITAYHCSLDSYEEKGYFDVREKDIIWMFKHGFSLTCGLQKPRSPECPVYETPTRVYVFLKSVVSQEMTAKEREENARLNDRLMKRLGGRYSVQTVY